MKAKFSFLSFPIATALICISLFLDTSSSLVLADQYDLRNGDSIILTRPANTNTYYVEHQSSEFINNMRHFVEIQELEHARDYESPSNNKSSSSAKTSFLKSMLISSDDPHVPPPIVQYTGTNHYINVLSNIYDLNVSNPNNVGFIKNNPTICGYLGVNLDVGSSGDSLSSNSSSPLYNQFMRTLTVQGNTSGSGKFRGTAKIFYHSNVSPFDSPIVDNSIVNHSGVSIECSGSSRDDCAGILGFMNEGPFTHVSPNNLNSLLSCNPKLQNKVDKSYKLIGPFYVPPYYITPGDDSSPKDIDRYTPHNYHHVRYYMISSHEYDLFYRKIHNFTSDHIGGDSFENTIDPGKLDNICRIYSEKFFNVYINNYDFIEIIHNGNNKSSEDVGSFISRCFSNTHGTSLCSHYHDQYTCLTDGHVHFEKFYSYEDLESVSAKCSAYNGTIENIKDIDLKNLLDKCIGNSIYPAKKPGTTFKTPVDHLPPVRKNDTHNLPDCPPPTPVLCEGEKSADSICKHTFNSLDLAQPSPFIDQPVTVPGESCSPCLPNNTKFDDQCNIRRSEDGSITSEMNIITFEKTLYNSNTRNNQTGYISQEIKKNPCTSSFANCVKDHCEYGDSCSDGTSVVTNYYLSTEETVYNVNSTKNTHPDECNNNLPHANDVDESKKYDCKHNNISSVHRQVGSGDVKSSSIVECKLPAGSPRTHDPTDPNDDTCAKAYIPSDNKISHKPDTNNLILNNSNKKNQTKSSYKPSQYAYKTPKENAPEPDSNKDGTRNNSRKIVYVIIATGVTSCAVGYGLYKWKPWSKRNFGQRN